MRFLGSSRDSSFDAKDGSGGYRHSCGGVRGGLCGRSHKSSRPIVPHPSSSLSHSQNPPDLPAFKASPVREGTSYADVARTPPFIEPPPFTVPASLKRRRSPDSGDFCKKCLRSGHKIEDCRHQLTCKRCSGVGHFAIRCTLCTPPPRPDAKKPRVRSKHISLGSSTELKPLLRVPVRSSPTSLRVSLPITEAILKSKDLKKMVIIRVLSGNARVRSLHTFLSQCSNPDICEHITPFNNYFVLTMETTRDAAMVVNRSPLSLNFPLGPCCISLSHWTAEFGSHVIAVGNYNWTRISNLPLHC